MNKIESLKDITTEHVVVMYTDGACSGNPGMGGWATIIIVDGQEVEFSGSDPATTNNRMEMMAAIQGLKALPIHAKVKIYTDSKYLQDGITIWIKGWKTKGWLNAAKQPVKNQDLWQELDAITKQFNNIEWHWIRGHGDNILNNRVDALAKRAIIAMQMKTK